MKNFLLYLILLGLFVAGNRLVKRQQQYCSHSAHGVMPTASVYTTDTRPSLTRHGTLIGNWDSLRNKLVHSGPTNKTANRVYRQVNPSATR